MDENKGITGEEFAVRLDKLIQQFNEDVVSLVHSSQASHGLDWNTDKAMPFHDDSNIERRIDDLACIAGWISDRLNGYNRFHKKSLTKKIRKALGYTYP